MHKLNGRPVGSNLFVPKKPIEHKVRINSNLQKRFVIMSRYLYFYMYLSENNESLQRVLATNLKRDVHFICRADFSPLF